MVYNPINVASIPKSKLQFTEADDTFIEILLLKIRGQTIKFQSALKKNTNELELKLETDIEDLENNCFPGSIENFMIKSKNCKTLGKTKSRQ